MCISVFVCVCLPIAARLQSKQALLPKVLKNALRQTIEIQNSAISHFCPRVRSVETPHSVIYVAFPKRAFQWIDNERKTARNDVKGIGKHVLQRLYVPVTDVRLFGISSYIKRFRLRSSSPRRSPSSSFRICAILPRRVAGAELSCWKMLLRSARSHWKLLSCLKVSPFENIGA